MYKKIKIVVDDKEYTIFHSLRIMRGISALFHRKRTIILLTLLMMLGYYTMHERTYVSTAGLYLIPNVKYEMGVPTDNQSTMANQAIVEDYAYILKSSVVLDSVYQSYREVLSKHMFDIQTNVTENSWIIHVRVTMDNATLAKKLLTSVIHSFQNYVKRTGQLQQGIIIDQPNNAQPTDTLLITAVAFIGFIVSCLLVSLWLTLRYHFPRLGFTGHHKL